MKAYFSLALLSAATYATGAASQQEQADFLQFIATNQKNYHSMQEMEGRLGIYHDNNQTVEELNRNNVGVSFKMNWSSDMTDEEFSNTLGVSDDLAQQAAQDSDGDNRRLLKSLEGRRLPDEEGNNYSKNWVEENRVSPVKDQGYCGSCWAFAATTCQEAVQAIKDDIPPVHISEQEAIDCTTSAYGCKGGWMSSYWKYSKESGSQSAEGYPYQAWTNDECLNQDDKTVISRAADYGYITGDGEEKITLMKQQLQVGPMTVAVGADQSCWRFYESGVLTADHECSTSINHGVVLVGLKEAEVQYERTCRKGHWQERRALQCEGYPEEKLEPNKQGTPNRHCCTYTPIDNGDNQSYWIIQNSWGTNWGQDGFIHLAVETGAGISGMNQYVNWMTVQD